MLELQKLMNKASQWSNNMFGEKDKNPAAIHQIIEELQKLLKLFEKFDMLVETKGEKPREGMDIMIDMYSAYADCFIYLLISLYHLPLDIESFLQLADERIDYYKLCKWEKFGKMI